MERITRVRAIILLLLFALLLTGYGARMYSVQILGNGDVVENSSTLTYYTTVKAARGDILDRNGNVLVSNRASYNLVFTNFVLMSSENPNQSLLKLVQLCQERGIEYIDHFPVSLEKPYEYVHDQFGSEWKGYFQSYLAHMQIDSDISANLLIQKLREYYKLPKEWTDQQARSVLGLRYELALRNGDISNLPAYILVEDVSDDDLNAIMELNIPGLEAEVSTVREYNTIYAPHILGSMKKIGAEEWPEYKDKGYSMDAEIGASGLEKAFEEQLHGTDGQLVRTVDKNGNIIREYYSELPVAGHNVEVTLDLELQQIAEDSLAYYIQNLQATGGIDEGTGMGSDAEKGAVVALEVGTGKVLACASYPTYDLTKFRDPEYFKELNEDEKAPMFNRALQAAYPPGSTYKMVTAVAGMENQMISRYTEILTKGIYTKYDGDQGPMCLIYSRTGANHGLINVSQALSVSCNWFFYEVGDMLTSEQLDETAKNFGLGEPTGIELYEETGHRANPETKAEIYKGSDAKWYPGDKILAAIGQSENRFTPMQLASYTATLATKGTRYACTFLNRVVSADYSTLVEETVPEVLSTVKMSSDTVDAIFQGMNSTTHTGTASYYYSTSPDAWYKKHSDIEVCAKTGTAEHGSGGSPHGSFVCFAPKDDPKIAIAVYIEKAGQGGYGANIANAIMEAYFAGDKGSDMITYENRVG